MRHFLLSQSFWLALTAVLFPLTSLASESLNCSDAKGKIVRKQDARGDLVVMINGVRSSGVPEIASKKFIGGQSDDSGLFGNDTFSAYMVVREKKSNNFLIAGHVLCEHEWDNRR